MSDVKDVSRLPGGARGLRTALRMAIRTTRTAMAAMFVGALIASALEPLAGPRRSHRRASPKPGAGTHPPTAARPVA